VLQGYDASTHVLTCFGGAGGQHACAIAAALGMSEIFIHKCGALPVCVIEYVLKMDHLQGWEKHLT
jgi:N-methylhydantoinase A/oxoprolinase/acetone carboxylase beta subunit